MSETGKEYGELKKEIKQRLEKDRVVYAMKKLMEAGVRCYYNHNFKYIEFDFKGSLVRFFPFTGWATGKTIKDGRGLQNLLKQIKEEEK